MRALRVLGYVGFFLFSLLLGLYLSFPWDAAKDRILAFASQKADMTITAKSLEPHWLTGVKLEGLSLQSPGSEAPLTIDKLTARASVLALVTGKVGGSIFMPVAQGTVDADFARNAAGTQVKAEVQDVELALVPGLKEKLGLPFGGKIGAKSDLYLDAKDTTKTEGTLALRGVGLELLSGGKLAGFPVPELSIGDFDWQIPVSGGRAKLSKQAVKGESVELEVDGEIALMTPLERSALNMTVSFKPTDAFLKKEPILNALLANIASARRSDGFYAFALGGTLKNPRFSPRRG